MVVVFCQGSPFKLATRNTYIDTNKTLLNTDKKNLSSFFFSFQSDYYSDFVIRSRLKNWFGESQDVPPGPLGQWQLATRLAT